MGLTEAAGRQPLIGITGDAQLSLSLLTDVTLLLQVTVPPVALTAHNPQTKFPQS